MNPVFKSTKGRTPSLVSECEEQRRGRSRFYDRIKPSSQEAGYFELLVLVTHNNQLCSSLAYSFVLDCVRAP